MTTCARIALLALLSAASPAAIAQFSIGAPTTDWTAIPYGPTALGDLKTDHQTGQGEADIVGNTSSLATSLPSFYCKFVAGTTATNGTLHYRVRTGGDQSPSGFKSVLLIGLDANKDGKLDLFMGVDNSGQSDGIYIWRPGTGLNISPSTTSMESRMPVKKYSMTPTNYHWGAVDSASATAGVVLDPSADTALRKDFNGATGTDYLLSFSVPFADVVAALGAQGIAFNSSSPATYVMGTATQANSFNQDLNGVSGGTTSTVTWGALGVLTQPVTPSGQVVNVAPVNTVPASRTANGSLAVTGVSVNDPDGNLATVQLTATNGTISVSLAGGAAIVTGANASANVTLGGTQSQINAALATLGYTPTVGYTGSASLTVQSIDSGALTDLDSVAITVISAANTAPTATPDTASTHSGKPAVIYVIGNDVDADGNVLTITSATLASGSGTVSSSNGSVTYTPTTSFVGTAVINYSIADGFGGTSSSTLTVNVSANNAPVAVNDVINATPGTTIFIPVLANDSDANGDSLIITAASRTSGNGSVTIAGNELQFAAPNQNGTTTLSYTISDGFGGTASATVTVTMGANGAPVAVNDSASTTAGAAVEVNVLGNDSDPNGDPLLITDAVVTSGSGTALAVNNKLRFTPTADFIGTATVTYTIDDNRGGTASAVLTVTVTGNTAPVATAESYTIAEDSTLTIGAPGLLANDTDADGNMLTAALLTSVSHGSLTLNADGSFTYVPTANYNGTDSFTYRASDGSLSSNSVTVSLTVTPVNDAPVASAEAYTVAEDGTLTISAPGVLTDDTDVEGSPLSAVLVSGVSHGTLSLNANGSFSYSPTPNYNGPDSFTYQASDGSLTSNPATVSITVTPVNDAPVAVPESYTATEDTTLTVAANGVLTNDSDIEGTGLTAVLVSGVSHGTLTLDANGGFVYTPAANYHGSDSFAYQVNDGALDSNIVPVSITVTPINDAPVAVADTYSVAEDDSLAVLAPGITSNDGDVDGDSFAAVLVSGVSHGILALNADGSFLYSPAANYNGPDSFAYKLNDTALDSNTVTVSIAVTPGNDAPAAFTDSYSIPQGSALNTTAPGVLGNDIDVDGDSLSAILVTSVTHGTMSLNADGSFTYLPAAGYSGPDSFTYKARDAAAESTPVTVSITVSAVNAAPVATGDNFTMMGGTTLTVPAPGVLGNDSDADGNSLTAVLASNPAQGTLALNANGSFSYTPGASFTGTETFSYRASDGLLNSSTVTVSINVIPPPNKPPVLTVQASLATTVAVPITFVVSTSDPDGDVVTVTANQPAHGTVSGSGPSFTYTPASNFAGSDSFSIVANDGRGGVVSRVIKVLVTALEGTIGNYALHLRNAQGEVAGHLVMTATRLGRATGVLTIGGIRYTARGFFGGAPSVIQPRSRGFAPVTLALDVDGSVVGAPKLMVTATDGTDSYTGTTARSPYSAAKHAPQAGKYTLIASRQQMVLDRTGAELPEAPAGVPMVASALAATVLPSGSVVFKGLTGHGYPLVCSSWVMADSNVPFYAGRRNPGASIQYSTLLFPPDPATMSTETTAPAVSGTLHWAAAVDRRIPAAFEADYAVLGARYTVPADGAALLNSPSLTLSLEIPSYRAAGLTSPYEETRPLVQNILPQTTGNISAIRVTFSSGVFIARVQGAVTRPIFGVIIQGEGIDRGMGSVADFTSCGTCELRPASEPVAVAPQ